MRRIDRQRREHGPDFRPVIILNPRQVGLVQLAHFQETNAVSG